MDTETLQTDPPDDTDWNEPMFPKRPPRFIT